MARINVRNNIEIERNPVEKILMKVKDYIRDNRRVVLYSLVSILVITILSIGISVFLEQRSKAQRLRYETILRTYQLQGADNRENIEKTIEALRELNESCYFGFVHEMTRYSMGNLYFNLGRYDEAEKNLLAFADSASSDLFAALALQKAALAAEERKDLDRALELYKKLEENYANSVLGDQILYNLGRIYGLKNDVVMAKKYYNNIVVSFPQSVLAEKAKKRLLLLGLVR